MFSSVIEVSCIEVIFTLTMSFSLDNPGFATSGEDLANVMDLSSQYTSVTSSSVPSSGDSSRRSCPRRHGRMSSFFVDRHSICTKCRGAECNLNCGCDECLSWSVEEMEAYVKLHKSLASKSKKKSSNSVKSPSTPGPSAPFVDVDDKIRSQFEIFSQDVDSRKASMSSAILNRLLLILVIGFTNQSIPAEPGVSGHTLPTGQSPPLRHSVSTHVNLMRFQSDAGGPMPQSSGSALHNLVSLV